MAFSKTAVAAPVVTPPAAELPSAYVENEKGTHPVSAPVRSSEDKKVKGQVAMHAIIAGYNAASRLVLTLAPKPAESEEMLHTLAAKIAAKIEAYSFHE